MKITNTTQTNHRTNISFGMLPIAKGIVHKPTIIGKTPIGVDICLINAEDESYMRSIFKKWKRSTTYGKNILNEYFQSLNPSQNAQTADEQYRFFAVMPSKTHPQSLLSATIASIKGIFHSRPKKEEPLCIGMVKQTGDNFELQLMQTSGDILNKRAGERISGAGQMLVYGITKFVKTVGGEKLDIRPGYNIFFEKIFKIKKESTSPISLTPEAMSKHIRETQEKFKLKDNTITVVDEVMARLSE